MSRFQVVLADFLTDDLHPERAALGSIADVYALNAFSEAELVGKVETADAIMLYHNVTLTRATIERLKQCKLIIRCGVGFDNVDHKLARKHGIPVANVPDYGTEEVADSAIGLMLSLTRAINLLNHRLQRGVGPWSYTQAAPLVRLRGRGFGIIGMGRIGTAVAMRAKAIGMNVMFYDPYIPDGTDKAIGVTRIETLDELLAKSHVISPHCPLTAETRHIVNAAAIAKMPRGSYLVNSSRGAVVDVAAIPSAIASGQLAGAAIDVLEDEPPAESNPLVAVWRDPNHPAHDRVIVNPHSAFYTVEGLHDIRVKSAEACRRALLNLPLRNIVN
jgi:C-terminal binding protein